MYKWSGQKINKETLDFTHTLDDMALTIYKHSVQKQNTQACQAHFAGKITYWITKSLSSNSRKLKPTTWCVTRKQLQKEDQEIHKHVGTEQNAGEQQCSEEGTQRVI